MAIAGVEALASLLHEIAPRNSGLKTLQQLVSFAPHTVSSGITASAHTSTLKILCDQLDHTQTNLAQLEQELDTLLDTDQGAKGVQSVPEFGRMMVAGLRADDACRSDGSICWAGYSRAAERQMQMRGQAF